MSQSKRKRILIVEDSLTFRKLLSKKLQGRGIETVTAKSGLEGLALAKKLKPDLIVLDIMLPGMDGHKICHLIKFDKNLQNIPVVMYTSRDLEEDAERAKASHADAFVPKSTNPAIMMDVIDKLLKKYEKSSIEAIS
jgi:CheY-like chemotaxis protein